MQQSNIINIITHKYEPQQKHHLGMVSKKITGGLKPVLRVPNLALSFYHGSKHTVVRSAWRFSNSSMDHHVKQINDEAKIRTRQKRVATDTWRSLGCRTTPLEHWSKRKPTVEPRFNDVIKKLTEKSRKCINHKPQPTPDTKRKRKRTKTNTYKTSKQMHEKHTDQLSIKWYPREGNAKMIVK